MRKVLVSLPENDLRVIDIAARKGGETRSSFVRRAALAEALGVRRPIDDPAAGRAFSRLLRRAERNSPISTVEALEARDRGAADRLAASRVSGLELSCRYNQLDPTPDLWSDNMKRSELFSACAISLLLLASCKSEIDNKPAAAVSEPAPAPSSEPVATATTAPVPSGQLPPLEAGLTPLAVIKDSSSIGFVGAKVTEDHPGVFKTFDGRVGLAGKEPKAIDFVVDLSSVDTTIAKLNGHLKSPDFFDVEKHPYATFASTSIVAGGTTPGATHTITGDLTLRGTTKSVALPATVTVKPEGIVAKSEFTIDRQQWGVSYKGAADNLIKDAVLIKLDLKFPPAG